MARKSLETHDHSNPANGGRVIRPNELHASETITVGGAEVSPGIPSGVIVMWSGEIAEIPEGWSLCDGTGETPDLTDRFVVGAGDSYNPDEIGGADEVTLTEDEMPSHNHGVTMYEGSQTNTTIDGDNGSVTTGTQNTSTEGGDQPHENRPPYYALAYIMRE